MSASCRRTLIGLAAPVPQHSSERAVLPTRVRISIDDLSDESHYGVGRGNLKHNPLKRDTMIDVENRASFLQAAHSGLNLFAGAGWSVMAKSDAGPLPVGSILADELRREFDVDADKALDLSQLATVIDSRNSQGLEEFLRKRYSVSTFDDRYQVLKRLALQAIFTTNIDDLFESVFSDSDQQFLNDVYTRGSAASRAAIDLVKLHGSVRDYNRPFVFGPLDIASAAVADPDRWMLLRQRLRTTPTLFVGYSLQDAGTLQSLRNSGGSRELPGDAWIQIRPSEAAAGKLEYFKALGFQVITAETEELLDFLATNVSQPQPKSTVDLSLSNIPDSTQTPARPLEDFFLGAAPSWSDVYSTQVVRLSHFATLLDHIAAGRNTVLSGIPGSGKTTLLMQAAAHAEFDGPRIMLDSPSEPQAKLYCKQIADRKALVFVDNVAGDIESLLHFTRLPNTTVIAADRDYNLSSVAHRVSKADVAVRMATSALRREDLQRVRHSIPHRIKTTKTVWPDTTNSTTPTVSEMVRANLSAKNLDERLIDYVNAIYRSEPEDALMLVLACYMHYSRVPLSMDVALAFFRDHIDDYTTIYSMLGSVGDLLLEDEDSAYAGNQDYFVARSMQVAENVLLNIPGSLLRTMLIRFHDNVTPLRIPDYNKFRRRGYDSRLFSRAFASWHAGAEEYDKILEKLSSQGRDQRYYVEQQKALFLAEHRQFDEAFKEIDKARGSKKQVNFTIENTYNKILFRANVDKAGDSEEARNLCLRALTGLASAYEKDSRKGQHALVYADCSLKLSRVLTPTMAIEYLTHAEAMLESVIRGEESWLERPKHLIGAVRNRLRDLS